MSEPKTGVEIKVIEWADGRQEVAIYFRDFDQMLTLDATSARHMAFLLMESSDHISPPFSDEPSEDSKSIFGPYKTEEPEYDEDEDDEDD